MPESTKPCQLEVRFYNAETGSDLPGQDLTECFFLANGEQLRLRSPSKDHPGVYNLHHEGRMRMMAPPIIKVGCDTLTPRFPGGITFDASAECHCCLRVAYVPARQARLLVRVLEHLLPHRDRDEPHEDHHERKPLPNARVELSPVDPAPHPTRIPLAHVITAYSDACGFASFDCLSENTTYQVSVVPPPDRARLIPLFPEEGRQCHRFCSTETTTLDFVFAAMLSRTWLVVHDEYGKPYAGNIELCRVAGHGEPGYRHTVTTDSSGVAILKNPRLGHYSVTSAGSLLFPDVIVTPGLQVRQLSGSRMQTSMLRIRLESKSGRPLTEERAELVKVAGGQVVGVKEVVYSNHEGYCQFQMPPWDPQQTAVRVRSKLISVGAAASQARLDASAEASGMDA